MRPRLVPLPSSPPPLRCPGGWLGWTVRHAGLLGLLLAAGWGMVPGVSAQTTPPTLTVPWWTIDAGGGSSTASVYRISGTIGQWDAHTPSARGGGLGLDGGFWPGLSPLDPRAPEIELQPVAPPPLPPGQCFSLFVEASGLPAPRFQWRRNGIYLRGATNRFLDLCLTNDSLAGTYDVLVANALGTVRSDPAIVRQALPPLPFSDEFSERGVLTTMSGRGEGDTTTANRLPGEPLHNGKRGGKSTWITYRAPATGILTLDTVGSSFDTLLAVYQGTQLGQLSPVVSDDDNGQFYRSRVRFLVVKGRNYEIAVDGRAGVSGTFQLNWDLLETALIPPRFRTQPQSLTVHAGQQAVFEAEVDNGGDLRWFRNGIALQDDGRITGSRTRQLVIRNARPTDVGTYRLIGYVLGIEVPGQTATLHLDLSPLIGAVIPSASGFDKFADARDDAQPPTQPFAPRRLTGGGIPLGLTRGTTVLTDTSDFGTSVEESLLCLTEGGASAWFYYQQPTNGLVVVETTGSSYDPVAGVFADPTGDPADLVQVDCNDDAFPEVTSSRIIFQASANQAYALVVDDKAGLGGNLITSTHEVAPTTLTAGRVPTEGTFSLRASGEPGLHLVLEWSGTLGGTWQPMQTNALSATGTTEHLLSTTEAEALYFRVRADLTAYPLISIQP
jgi:hypothetical protein